MKTKQHILTLCLLAVGLFATTSCHTDTIKCKLQGKVIDRAQSTEFILYKQGEDPRIHGIKIPIIAGEFQYVLNTEHIERYELAFLDEYEAGSWRYISFFSEPGLLKFTLYPVDRFNETKIEGGKLTKEYWDVMAVILERQDAVEKEFLAKSKQYLEDQCGQIFEKSEISENDLVEAIEKLEKDEVDIEPIINVITEMEVSLDQQVYQEIKSLKWQFIQAHHNLAGYDMLVSETTSMLWRNRHFKETQDISAYANLYKSVFAPTFPEHPYSEKMEDLFAGLAIAAGVPFVDFTAMDLQGRPVKLSERIAGQPTVLNLWASWCGPCRKKGKEWIPLYEKFGEQGLVVIGVAREKNTADAETAIKKDKYPWENLVELNDAARIWAKYGIENSGGSLFLIDENGIIVAINPNPNEVSDFLKRFGTTEP